MGLHLLRFEERDLGPVYVDARAQMFIARDGMDTNLGVVFNGVSKDLTIAGDVDEVAQAIERAYPDARIYIVST